MTSQYEDLIKKAYSAFDERDIDNTALSSYTEIREKSEWTETEIAERHKRIPGFAKQYFDTSDL